MRKTILSLLAVLCLSGCISDGTQRPLLSSHYYYNNKNVYKEIVRYKAKKCFNSEEAYYRTIKGLYLNRSPTEMQYRGCK